MSNSIIKKVFSGIIWTYAERLLAQSVTICVTVILARIISPEQYGIVSIVVVLINIANSFVTGGFGNSLIQKKDADDLDFSTVFHFSFMISLILYFIVFVSADYIASFYAIPELALVIEVMALRLPIAAINSIQQAYISKKMQFKKFFFATLWGTVVSAIVGMALAYYGFGIWAVVAQYLSNALVDTVVLWFTSGWTPKLIYSKERMGVLFSFGWRIMLVSVMTTLYSNLRNLIIGKKYSASDLAFSEKGEQFPSAISGNINSSLTQVMFPVLSEYQDDTEVLLRMVRRSIKVGSYILFPIMFGFATISDTFVVLFLTDKWIGCVPFLQIMCAVYALQPLQTSSLQCIKAIGKSSLYLWIDVCKKIVGVAILLVTVLLGNDVIIIVWGALFIEIFSVLVLWPFNKCNLGYSYKRQLFDILPNMALSLLMCYGIQLFNNIIQSQLLIQMMIDIIGGGMLYLALSHISKNESYVYLKGFVRL